jgi:hypothetical protein
MRYSWQIVRKLQEKDELNEEEMTDLIDYLNILKEELKKLRIILYMDYLGYVADFDVVFKEPWFFSEVRLKCLEIERECGFLYLDSFLWRIFTDQIVVKPFLSEVTNP